MNRCLRIAVASLEEEKKKGKKKKKILLVRTIRLPMSSGVNRQEDLETYARTHESTACNRGTYINSVAFILFRIC